MPKAAKSSVGKKVVHPNSRAAAVLARKAHRDQRLDKNSKARFTKLELQGQRLLWFQEQVDRDAVSYTKEEVCDLIEKYFHRFDDELEQISIVQGMKGRTGDQHASRKDAINITLEQERKEYEGLGFEIVDLTNGKSYKSFIEWNGELRFIQNLKLKKYRPVETASEGVKDGKDKNDQSDTVARPSQASEEGESAHSAKETSVTPSTQAECSSSTNPTEHMDTEND